MRFSIAIPHYNRINYLLESLRRIDEINYDNLEVVVSDDCSSDDSESVLRNFSFTSPKKFKYSRNLQNLGFDGNLRKALRGCSGDYLIMLGNDDSLNSDLKLDTDVLNNLANFLIDNNFPDIGISNYIDFSSQTIYKRVFKSGIYRRSKYNSIFSSFVFFSGIIVKSDFFNKYDVDFVDGSVYYQMFLVQLAMLREEDATVFGFSGTLVISSLTLNGEGANSFVDTLPRSFKEMRPLHGGLFSVIDVYYKASKYLMQKSNKLELFSIGVRIIMRTSYYWLVRYKMESYWAFMSLAVGLFKSILSRIRMFGIIYSTILFVLLFIVCIISLITPIKLFNKYVNSIYNWLRSWLYCYHPLISG